MQKNLTNNAYDRNNIIVREGINTIIMKTNHNKGRSNFVHPQYAPKHDTLLTSTATGFFFTNSNNYNSFAV